MTRRLYVFVVVAVLTVFIKTRAAEAPVEKL